MSFKGESQQLQQSMNAGGGDTHFLHRAALYVILDGRENEHDNSPTALRDGLSFGDDSPFTEIIYLKPVTLREYSENTNHNTLRSDSSHGNDCNNTAENAWLVRLKQNTQQKPVKRLCRNLNYSKYMTEAIWRNCKRWIMNKMETSICCSTKIGISKL